MAFLIAAILDRFGPSRILLKPAVHFDIRVARACPRREFSAFQMTRRMTTCSA